MFLRWVTAEGDTIVMQMQLAKFLVKSARKPPSPLPEQIAYLAGFAELDKVDGPTLPQLPADPSTLQLLEYLLASFETRALVAVIDAVAQLDSYTAQSAGSPNQAMDNCMLPMCHAAKCHSLYLMLRSFIQLGVRGANTAAAQPACALVLSRLAVMFGLSTMIDQNWNGLLNRRDSLQIQQLSQRYCDGLRGDLVALVDSFDIPDRVLNSTIGRSDGKVYEALMRSARKSELNRVDPFVGALTETVSHLDPAN